MAVKSPPAGQAKTAEAWLDEARALRAGQHMVAADAAIAQAHALAPQDRLIAFLRAQSRYELGYPAADAFAEAARLWPDNLDARRNQALALASQGDVGAARQVLEAALAAHPGWLDGHRVLASLRWAAGEAEGFDSSFPAALRIEPRQQGLWLGWFSAVAQLRDWPRARDILDRAEVALGATRQIAIARAFVACESGDGVEARHRLAQCAGFDDEFLTLARIRFALREGEVAGALALALPLTDTAFAGQVWPYVHACWRLLGDPRAQWLAGDPPLIGVEAVDLSGAELAELAALLRALHTAKAPYAEQSVRLGTQTDRSVLLRHEPILQRARAALLAAARRFVASLPPHDPTHPVLGRARESLTVSGSWSVRLGAGGFNVVHSHPLGWLSSAFYVALPDRAQMGPEPCGAFQLGGGPPELGLDLPPLATIAPVVGQLVIFPSIMWHGTVPIAGGERLNIAFDMVGGE